MSEDVTASVSGSAPNSTSRGSERYADSGGGFRGAVPSILTRKNPPMALEETVKGSRHALPRTKEKGPRSLRTEGLAA